MHSQLKTHCHVSDDAASFVIATNMMGQLKGLECTFMESSCSTEDQTVRGSAGDRGDTLYGLAAHLGLDSS